MAASRTGRSVGLRWLIGSDARLVLGAFLAALAAGLLFARAAPETYDSEIMLQVTESLLHHGSFVVRRDGFGFNTPYSTYGVGMSLLMLPPYAFAEWLGRDPVSAAMDVNAFVYAATVAGAVVFARMAGLSHLRSAAVGGLVALGTGILPYTATGFSEPATGLAVLVCLIGVLAVLQHRGWGAALAGLGAGVALLMRTDSLVLVVPFVGLAVWLAARRAWRPALVYGAVFAPFFIALLAYNNLRFGSPLQLGYSNDTSVTFNHPLVKGVLGLLVSPGRGLILYVPLTLVVAAVMLRTWRRWPILTALAAVLLVVRLAFYARWWAWNGGWCWGPRFLVPAMPVFVVGFVMVARRWDTWRPLTRALLVLLIGISAVVQVTGAAVRYEASPLTTKGLILAKWDGSPEAVAPENQRIADDALFDWSLFAIRDQFRMMRRGEAIAGKLLQPPWRPRRLAALAVLGIGGIVLALAPRRQRRDLAETGPRGAQAAPAPQVQ